MACMLRCLVSGRCLTKYGHWTRACGLGGCVRALYRSRLSTIIFKCLVEEYGKLLYWVLGEDRARIFSLVFFWDERCILSLLYIHHPSCLALCAVLLMISYSGTKPRFLVIRPCSHGMGDIPEIPRNGRGKHESYNIYRCSTTPEFDGLGNACEWGATVIPRDVGHAQENL